MTAAARGWNQDLIEQYPSVTDVDASIPDRARTYLDQAINSLSSPAGAVMLAASAVDAMLKAKNLKEGSLYARIDKALADNLITAEMAAWAHDVRLDANDQRHADDEVSLPVTADAKRAVDFRSCASAVFVCASNSSSAGDRRCEDVARVGCNNLLALHLICSSWCIALLLLHTKTTVQCMDDCLQYTD